VKRKQGPGDPKHPAAEAENKRPRRIEDEPPKQREKDNERSNR